MADDTEPRFLIHQATHLFLTEPVYFQVIQMNNASFVWVGRNQAKLSDLSVAVPSLRNQSIPSATTVLGNDVSEVSRNIAPLKYEQQFYVSLDIGDKDDLLNAFVEKKLMILVKSILS
ncbi:uncharacterized protein BYT42DRAFT_489224 [Radiomyces spectabilis]|uniref:uncharacterized protein n=1 Tax=Radiomyces spectabilis TaxID=64574 RepID=UPI002220A5A2|nr:uncharacterized protein BYT42DRAFT_489224 [Radiomyces spectabilis]KAI8390855.1 hypothetical protein BYT42DRAFT_489224 [Radiomyces spectabilis]